MYKNTSYKIKLNIFYTIIRKIELIVKVIKLYILHLMEIFYNI